MKEQGIANANQLAVKCGVHRATAAKWMEGQIPEGQNAAVLSSVLAKSLPWLMGTPIAADQRVVIARAVRAELGQNGSCPEADIIEAFGGFSFEQRKLLVDIILHGAGKIENVRPLADAREASALKSQEAPAVTQDTRQRKRPR